MYSATVLPSWHGTQWAVPREDLMIYRGPGFLAVARFGSSPNPFPPLPAATCLSFSVFPKQNSLSLTGLYSRLWHRVVTPARQAALAGGPVRQPNDRVDYIP
jgi:hypothetical protein